MMNGMKEGRREAFFRVAWHPFQWVSHADTLLFNVIGEGGRGKLLSFLGILRKPL